MHDNLTAKDLARLTEAMSRQGLSRLECSLDGLDVEIEWKGAAGDDTNVFKTREQSSLLRADPIIENSKVPTSGVVRAAVAGALNWQDRRALEPGDWVQAGQLVASTSTGSENAEIISPIAGQVLHVQPFENGAFVACGQWLFSIGS